MEPSTEDGFEAKRSNVIFETGEEQALRNSLILNTIMTYLCPSDLKQCRLVNQTWCLCATSLTLHQDAFRVRFKCDPSNYTIFTQYSSYSGGFASDTSTNLKSNLSSRTLEMFNSCLEKSSQFPSTNFHFEIYQEMLKSLDIQQFFDQFGPLIKTLSFRFAKKTFISKETFFKILTSQAPNIEYLKIDRLEFDQNENESNIQLNPLPSLKKIRFVGGEISNEIFEILLRLAINLEFIHGFTLCLTNVILNANKLHLIKCLRKFKSYWPPQWTVQDTLKFAEGSPCLHKLQLTMPGRGYSHPEELTKSFFKILEFSKGHLKKLEMSELLYENNNISLETFPNLPNVTKLILKEPHGSGGHFFPLETCLNEKFPNLQTLALGSCYDWEKHFPLPEQFEFQQNGISSVKNLEIQDNLSETSLERIRRLCPNFKNLKLKNGMYKVHQFLPKIWSNWKQLECLEIEMKNLRNLDEAFTGISNENLQLLTSKPTLTLAAEQSTCTKYAEFENFERGPWIGSLSNLRELRIYFGTLSCYSGASSECPLTSLTGLYAFQLMPSLNVTIGYDHSAPGSHRLKSVLYLIEPFVNIVHRRCRTKQESDEE